jgi:hypothetical protein
MLSPGFYWMNQFMLLQKQLQLIRRGIKIPFKRGNVAIGVPTRNLGTKVDGPQIAGWQSGGA